MKRDLQVMQDRSTKNNLSAKLATYINEVCANSNDDKQHNPMSNSGWDAASALDCPPAIIDE